MVKSQVRFLRTAPRKARLVAKQVVGLSATGALAQLKYSTKRAADPVAKVVASAVANALHNHKIEPENLKVTAITVDSGPYFMRRRAGSRGRAVPIKKRTCHITVELTEVKPVKKAVVKAAAKKASTAEPKITATPAVETEAQETVETPAVEEAEVVAETPAEQVANNDTVVEKGE